MGSGLSRAVVSTRVREQAGQREGGGASVVSDGGQLGVQVHADVLVEAAEGHAGAVPQVVEAVQVLALFGVPQQFVPGQVGGPPQVSASRVPDGERARAESGGALPPQELHLPSVVVGNGLVLADLSFGSRHVQTGVVDPGEHRQDRQAQRPPPPPPPTHQNN